MIKDFFYFSIINLRKRKLRSWLTVIGIIIGIAAVVALLSLSAGLSREVERQFQMFGSDKIFITARFGGGTGMGLASSGGAAINTKDLDAVRGVSSVELAAGILSKQEPVLYKKEIKYNTIAGISADPETEKLFEDVQGFKIDQGRQIKSGDTSSVAVGSSFATDTFKENVSLRDTIEISGKTFKVVGIFLPIGNSQDDSMIIMPVDALRDLTGDKNSLTAIMAQVKAGQNVNDAKDDIAKALRKEKDQQEGEETFQVSTSEDILRLINQLFGTIQFVLVGIGAISLIVGAVGVTNTMYTSVLDRTKEIGIMKAIGAKNSDIMTIFLIESAVIGTIGGAAGIVLGALMAKVVEIAAGVTLLIPLKAYTGLDLIAGALLISLAIGAISGLLPARKAASLEPVDALRYE
jgi:putative ABC transport system permease protein